MRRSAPSHRNPRRGLASDQVSYPEMRGDKGMGSTPIRIVLLGGGFAGVYSAMELEKQLARTPDVEITLVSRENFFSFTPMLHEVASSDLDVTHIVNPVRKMLKRAHLFL